MISRTIAPIAEMVRAAGTVSGRNEADVCRSFAAAEWPYSDRLLRELVPLLLEPHKILFLLRLIPAMKSTARHDACFRRLIVSRLWPIGASCHTQNCEHENQMPVPIAVQSKNRSDRSS